MPNTFIGVINLLFIGFAIIIVIISSITIAILFKHAEKRSVATSLTITYISLLIFVLLAAFAYFNIV